jgi:hypothetical protein
MRPGIKMNDEKKDQKEMVIDLNIRSSDLPGSGTVRVNEDILPHLYYEEKDKIIIYGKDKALLISVEGNNVISPSAIFIHQEDMDSLELDENGKVKVKVYESFFEKLNEIIERLNLKIDLYDEEKKT